MSNKLDLMALWRETLDLLQYHREMLIAVAGVFLLLPTLTTGLFVRSPDMKGAESFADLVAAMGAYVEGGWMLLLPASLFSMLGSLAILAVMMRPERPTVAAALAMAARLLPGYFLAAFLSSLAIFMGLSLLILPGLFVALKFVLIMPVAVAEGVRNPLVLLERSWRLTGGQVLALLVYLGVVLVTGLVAMSVLGGLVGIAIALLLPQGAAHVATVAVDSLLTTFLSVVMLLSYAAIYRRLAG